MNSKLQCRGTDSFHAHQASANSSVEQEKRFSLHVTVFVEFNKLISVCLLSYYISFVADYTQKRPWAIHYISTEAQT